MEALDRFLKDLYNGRLNPNEKIPNSDEYNKLIKKANKVLKKIENKIGSEGKALLNEYIEIRAQVLSIDCEQKFIDGYKTAIQLIIAGKR